MHCYIIVNWRGLSNITAPRLNIFSTTMCRDFEEDSDESKSVESESEEDSGNDKDSGAGIA